MSTGPLAPLSHFPGPRAIDGREGRQHHLTTCSVSQPLMASKVGESQTEFTGNLRLVLIVARSLSSRDARGMKITNVTNAQEALWVKQDAV